MAGRAEASTAAVPYGAVRLFWRTLITAIAIVVTAYIVPGISWGHASYGLGDLDKWASLGITALVLGLVNAFVRPILVMISLPLTLITLGLFLFVINAVMLLIVSAIPFTGFQVDGFVPALLGSILISIVGFVVSHLLPH